MRGKIFKNFRTGINFTPRVPLIGSLTSGVNATMALTWRGWKVWWQRGSLTGGPEVVRVRAKNWGNKLPPRGVEPWPRGGTRAALATGPRCSLCWN